MVVLTKILLSKLVPLSWQRIWDLAEHVAVLQRTHTHNNYANNDLEYCVLIIKQEDS